MIGLAFIHHLTIAKNIPLTDAVSWLMNIAPIGLIEFIPKNDPTIQQMIYLKGDIFPEYNEENFLNLIKKNGKIISINPIKDSGRKIIEFQK